MPFEFEPGQSYHVFNRSINKELLFRNQDNYVFFLKRFHQHLNGKVDLLCYCLMPTHFHLLIKAVAPTSEIEKGFKNFFISYAKAFNKMYNRNGGIFQAKYKKLLIEDDAYFTNIIAYIHLNPVKAGLCDHPADWPFSSYSCILSDSAIGSNEMIVEWYGGKQQFIQFHDKTSEVLETSDVLLETSDVLS